jgi:CheY-like chemotaxis protein
MKPLILFVEDSLDDVELSADWLKHFGVRFELTNVQDEAALRCALEISRPALIVSDFSLPTFDGMSALRVCREVAPEIPFIFYSGSIGDDHQTQAERLGAQGCIRKDRFEDFVILVKQLLPHAH